MYNGFISIDVVLYKDKLNRDKIEINASARMISLENLLFFLSQYFVN
jgi:hypothetical protein